MRELLARVRKRGLRGSLHLLRERCVYYHWELLTLERDLSPPAINRPRAERWPAVVIDSPVLPRLEKYFSRYLPTIRDLLNRDGVRGSAYLDENGDAVGIAWVSEHDYYDSHLYRCWIRLPPGCIYQFALEVAPAYQRIGIPILAARLLWAEYRARGFHLTRALVNTRNQVALSTHMGVGFREVGESVHVYCLFGCLHFSRRQSYSEPRLAHLQKPTRKHEEKV